ncbi:DUF3307 domain-containing protein [Brevibacillus sp. 179-C9.3 HS]|uniref:DUF3307 domain-containing protein n=1 Tax=unclassified Brevibacillus TaxID=2684853 RepID=UPI00399FA939
MLVLGLIVAHFIADFYLQTDEMVVHKQKNLRKHTIHHLVIMLLTFTVTFLFSSTPSYSWSGVLFQIILPSCLIALLHYLIDSVKIRLEGMLVPKVKANVEGLYKLVIFMIDQLLHIAILLVACQLFFQINSMQVIVEILKVLQIVKGEQTVLSPVESVLFMVMMFIIVTTVSGHMIRILIGVMPNHHTNLEGKYLFKAKVDELKMEEFSKHLDISEEFSYTIIKQAQSSRGTIIGYIERLLVVFLTIYGAYPAIGFIVTAKSFARLKQLDDREWAEYFILGTLTSMFMGLLCGIVIRNVLG